MTDGVGAILVEGEPEEARRFAPGEMITRYGVYRCACGRDDFFGISGRRFPRRHCEEAAWRLVHLARAETFF